jgi:hypothetical protein
MPPSPVDTKGLAHDKVTVHEAGANMIAVVVILQGS